MRKKSAFKFKKMQKQKYYIAKINLAIDYIVEHLDEKINLNEIAENAQLSPYHFHRIFKSIMGETVNDFVRRVRVEKAGSMLFTNPQMSITDVAFENGFSSSQSLAKEFHRFFKMTPSQYRKSKIKHIESKKSKDYALQVDYDSGDGRPIIYYQSKVKENMKVEIKTLPDMNLAYVRHIGPYKEDTKLFGQLFEKLCTWAGPRNLIDQDSKYLCIYYDGPEVTNESKLRLDVCITVPKNTEVDGEVGKQSVEGGRYAVARCIIKDPKEYGQYWNEIYTNWLPESGYQPDNKVPFEMYPAECKKENGDMIVDICIPVKKA